MTFKPARLLLALIALAASPAFAQNVAVVNGKAIPSSRAEAVVKQVVAQGRPDSKELRDLVKKDLIAREVMMQEATKQGYDKKEDVKTQIANARQAIMLNAMVEDYLKKTPVTDAAIKAEYDRYKAAASNEKEYHVRHILLETEAAAKDVVAKLKAGAKFEDLAKNSKDQGTAATGGDLDWHPAGDFPKVFSDAFVALQKGAVTETPVQTPNGFHVIKLDDSRPVTVPAMEEVKPQIAKALQEQKIRAYQDELVKKAKVEDK
jgi:peptidyl-prolyl cis-trans isomerase C